jgi:hypothetical protein
MEHYQYIMDLYLNTMTWKGVPVDWDDGVIVKEIINQYIDAFKKASDRLRDDPDFVRFVLNKSGYQLKYASKRLRSDIDFVNETVNKCIGALEYVDSDLLDDINFMKSVVQVHACAFRYASERLRSEYPFVEFAVRRRGSNIQYTAFKDDEFLVRLALERPDKELDCTGCEACCLEELDLNVLQYVSDRLQILFIDLALEYDYDVLFHPSHRDDASIVERAVRKHPHALKSASDRLKCDRDFIKKMVSINGYCLQYVNKDFIDDQEIVSVAIKDDISALQFASDRLQRELDYLIV